jgi:hypothetical protein
MAFLQSLTKNLPSWGTPTVAIKREGVATNVGTVTITVPSAGSFQTPTAAAGQTVFGTNSTLSSGYFRVKTVSIVAGGTVQLGVCTATDGSTTVALIPQQTALAANTFIDMVVPFRTDLNLTSITITVIAGTQNSVHDVEVVGNP